MKFLETSLNSNLDLEQAFPNLTSYLFQRVSVKFYKLYSLDGNTVIYADLHEKIAIVIIGYKKNISEKQITWVIQKLLPDCKTDIKITKDIKEKMIERGRTPLKDVKNIVLLECSAPDK